MAASSEASGVAVATDAGSVASDEVGGVAVGARERWLSKRLNRIVVLLRETTGPTVPPHRRTVVQGRVIGRR
jgi:hypothetical protein